jgi:PST family polysaccharide transporter
LLRRGLEAIRHPVSQNALALHAVQVGNLLVPLVTLPYVSRVLESNGFGLVAFAQSLSFLLSLIIGWGFDQWATRDAAVRRDDPAGLSALAAQVMGARLLLCGVALGLAALVYLTTTTTSGSPEFVAMAWLAAASTGLTPSWYFLGVERLRLVSSLALSLRALAAALTFVLVQDTGDAWIVMALFAGSTVLTAIVCTMLMLRDVRLVAPRFGTALSAIRSSAALFAGTAGITLYTAVNVVLLGFLGTRAEVAHFSAAERIVRGCIQLLQPVTAVIYPRITYLDSAGRSERGLRLLFAGSGLIFVAALAATTLALLFAPEIIRVIYGPEFSDAAGVLRVMAPIIPISTVTFAAATWLMVKRKDKRLMQVTLAGGIVNVALAPVLVHAGGIEGMGVSVLCAEVLVMTLALSVTAWRRRPQSA